MNFLKSIPTKTWIIIGIIIVLIIILIIAYNRNKSGNTTTNVNVVEPNVNTQQRPVFPLQYGSRGEQVRKWQMYLNTKGAGLAEDGIWGPLTEAASLKYMGFNSVTEQYFNTVIK